MSNRGMSRLLGLVSAVVIAMLALPALASAADRNNDNLPDGWEKRHKLSLKVKQAKRDQDRDGLRNMAEYRTGNSPRDDDSDDDGTEDGDENAGTITSFEDGVLTINLYGGASVSGIVDEDTEIKCHAADESSDDSSSSDRRSGDDNSGPGSENSGSGSENSGPGSGDNRPPHGGCNTECSTEDLVVGAIVEEADLELSNGKATFREIKLGETEDSA